LVILANSNAIQNNAVGVGIVETILKAKTLNGAF